MSELVSVIIPAYNHESYIKNTIESIINQTYENIELIILDDGSADSTWEKIQEMKSACEKRFTNIHFETKPNEGTSKTLNRLLSLCQGEFIYFIASDDISKPDSVETLVNFLIQNPDYSLAVGNNEIIDKDGRVCYWNKKRNIVYDKKRARSKTFVEYLKRHNNYFNDKEFGTYKTIFRGNYIPNGYLVRKSIFDIIGLYPEGQFTDDYWLMLQVSKYSKMKYIDKILYSYRWHNENTIKNPEKMNLSFINTLNLENEILKSVDKTKVKPDVLEVIEKGVVCKTQGIPHILEIETVKKDISKIKRFKILNCTIYENIKKI